MGWRRICTSNNRRNGKVQNARIRPIRPQELRFNMSIIYLTEHGALRARQRCGWREEKLAEVG
jgi:hypothetical protein